MGGAAALNAAGIYGLLDGLAATPARALADGSTPLPPEQHLLLDVQTITDNGVLVNIPPLHHAVITATLRLPAKRSALKAAQTKLERTLHQLDQTYPPTPRGLGLAFAWGLPYFQAYVARPAARYLPLDNRASASAGHPVAALIEAIRFPSDPEETILERNDLAVSLASDSLHHIAAATAAIFGAHPDLFDVTSIRKGFVGGGFASQGGGQSLPKQMALAAGIPGANLIPDTAELFLGFTSTQQAALGPTRICNLETLPGLTDQWPNGYFRYGTTMHLSHMYQDLEAWYRRNTYAQRVQRVFRPSLTLPPATQTTPEGAAEAESEAQVGEDVRQYGIVGHSAAMQPVSRLQADLTDNYGTLYPKGTAIPQRADFDTLDNPFFFSANPERDRQKPGYAAGLHFVVFAPTSDAFHRTRLAMDGHYPDGTVLPISPRSGNQGVNAVLHTTHRQNFLVPPRAHRSFPLAELL